MAKTPKTESQTAQILKWLKRGKSITPIEALNKFGCFRLASRANDLKNMGYVLEKKMIYTKDKHYMSYKLAK